MPTRGRGYLFIEPHNGGDWNVLGLGTQDKARGRQEMSGKKGDKPEKAGVEMRKKNVVNVDTDMLEKRE